METKQMITEEKVFKSQKRMVHAVSLALFFIWLLLEVL